MDYFYIATSFNRKKITKLINQFLFLGVQGMYLQNIGSWVGHNDWATVELG